MQLCLPALPVKQAIMMGKFVATPEGLSDFGALHARMATNAGVGARFRCLKKTYLDKLARL